VNLSYTIDDSTSTPLETSVEVTVDFPDGKRWLLFVTPDLLQRVGNYVDGTLVRVHLGERHMIVVSEVSADIVDRVLKELHETGELRDRTLPLDAGV
jgi:hypothetical protein